MGDGTVLLLGGAAVICILAGYMEGYTRGIMANEKNQRKAIEHAFHQLSACQKAVERAYDREVKRNTPPEVRLGTWPEGTTRHE